MSCYGPAAKKTKPVKLPYFPLQHTLKNGQEAKLVEFEDRYEAELYAILKKIVDEGRIYPQETMDTAEDFRAYFLTHECYCMVDAETDEVLGGFYVKPNFPGRCSHICNGGFIVKESARGNGVGSFLAEQFKRIAPDLGYKACFFNLVFVSNEVSLNLWRKAGFKEIGRIPKAGNLKGLGFVDAAQFYLDFSTLPKVEKA